MTGMMGSSWMVNQITSYSTKQVRCILSAYQLVTVSQQGMHHGGEY